MLIERVSRKGKESDVENRVVYPILTLPEYLEIPHVNIRGKTYLQPQSLDKAAGKTSGYYPDFSVWEHSFPLLIVEAKGPTIDSSVGYREASQYALHLNRQYDHSIDPCYYVIATNGQRLLAGYWNSEPEIDVAVEDFLPGSTIVELLRDRVRYDVLRQRSNEFRQVAATRQTSFATRGASTTALLGSQIAPNQFASALVPTLTRFFASPTDETDPAVYDTAYVPTAEQSSYDSILEGLLREKAHSYKNPLSKDIETTRNATPDFTNSIREYRDRRANTSQILLLIGHVGSGKSLFIRRYRELLVPSELSRTIRWSFLNFNDAPNLVDASSWVSRNYVESFEREQPDIDIYDPEMIDRIFSTELNRNRAVYERLERLSPLEAEKQRGQDIIKWKGDWETFSRALTRYFGGQRGDTCVAVFDNVDRMDKDDQLAAFQIALGFTAEHRTLTILQLRDETFERYKDSKPLDTFKTGLTFHITPPRFVDVVRRRLDLCIEELRQVAPKEWGYDLANGVKIRISREQALRFLTEIYDYVFKSDSNTSRVIQGLAGRDVRRALDIFFRVMISGHFGDDQITSAGSGGTSFPVTENLILRILMRGSARFFHEGAGFVSNIFYFESDWAGADNFLLSEILYWLARN